MNIELVGRMRIHDWHPNSSPTQLTSNQVHLYSWRSRVAWLLAFSLLLVACAEAAHEKEVSNFDRPKPNPGDTDFHEPGDDFEPGGFSEAVCGNGIIEGEELCDRNNLGGRTCESEGFAFGELLCTIDCKLETMFCNSCGNGVLDLFEECDGKDLGGMSTCADLNAGADDEPLLCTENCLFDLSNCGGCGDGTITSPEECEPETETQNADLGGVSCESRGWEGGELACNMSCRFDESGCHTCGDGIKTGPEPCDGLDLGNSKCGDFVDVTGKPYSSGNLHCTQDCKIDFSDCMRCGDGVITGTEACDGTDLRGKTCKTLGYTGGTLSCTPDCQVDESGCTTLDNPLFRCSTPGLWIPDNDSNGVTDTMQIPAHGSVTDVDVVVSIQHPWVGDLKVDLTHSAMTRTLLDRPGVPASPYGCAYRDIDATLDDEGMEPVENSCMPTQPAISGALIPDQSLSALNGRDMYGAWTLRVADLVDLFEGNLVEWCLMIHWQ